jgi:hypothetical protein
MTGVISRFTLIDRGRGLGLAFFARDPHLENREMWGTRAQVPRLHRIARCANDSVPLGDDRVILGSGVSAPRAER